jgi:hypothetical protein
MPSYSSGDWEFTVNEVQANADAHLEAFSALLLAAGWTLVQRSDGSSLLASGRNSVAEWGNADTWEHWRDPSGASGRRLIFQRGASDRQLRMWITTHGIPIADNTPTVSLAPSFTTKAQIIGTGGAYDTSFWHNGTAGNFRVHLGVRTTPAGTTGDVYEFWILSCATGTGNRQDSCYVFAVDTPADGTYGDADAEPWVSSQTWGVGSHSAWYRAGLSGATFVSVGLAFEISANLDGQNPYSLADDLPPVYSYDATGGVEQRKGVLESVRGQGIRADFDTYNLSVAGAALLAYDNLATPWPDSVTPVI